jgi:hypothetical protein
MDAAVQVLVRDRWAHHDFWCSPDQRLVYTAMLKCASCYFRDAFPQNGWTQIQFDTIDWDQQIVFGFMMEPRRRHVKGLVEDLGHDGWLSGIKVSDFDKCFSKRYPCIGVHTLGYHQVYGAYTQRIKWLPLDTARLEQSSLENFLRTHGVSWSWSVVDANVHRSVPEQLDLFERLWQEFPGERQSWYEIEYFDDVELWNKITKEAV